MSDILDLDLIAPKPKQIKVNGKIYEIFPPRVQDLINIQRLFGNLKDKTSEEQAEAIGQIKEVLQPFIPDIEEMKLYFPQLVALLEFVNTSEMPTEPQTTEKKTEVSPTP